MTAIATADKKPLATFKGNTSQLDLMLKASIVEVGKIKIGCGVKATSRNGVAYMQPKKLDHFIVTKLTRGKDDNFEQDADLMKSLLADYGDADKKLRRIPISVLSNDIEQIMQSKWYWYLGMKKAGESDGKTLKLYYKPTSTQQKPIPYDKPLELPWNPESGEEHADVVELVKSGAFKRLTRFNCVIRDKNAKFGGVYSFRTVGQMSGDRLFGSLCTIKDMTLGLVRMLPMELVVAPVKCNPLIKGVPTPSTVYVVHVEVLGSDADELRALAISNFNKQLKEARDLQRQLAEYRKIILSASSFESDDSDLPQLAPYPAQPATTENTQDVPEDDDTTPLEPGAGEDAPSHAEPVAAPAEDPVEADKPHEAFDPVNNAKDFESLVARKGRRMLDVFSQFNHKNKTNFDVKDRWPEDIAEGQRRAIVEGLNKLVDVNDPTAKAGGFVPQRSGH